MPLPERPHLGRPQLSRHVAARRHLTGEARVVLLVDRRDGRTMRLGEREWAVVQAMDGTRGPEGLVAAAARRGAATTVERVTEFVDELAAAGLLDDGAALAAPAAAAAETPADRPLERLPGYRLDCDGTGSCCRIYPTIVFLARDVARARVARPDVLDGGDDEAAAFTPVEGCPDGVSAPALVDGRCAYLLGDGRCGIQAASGADAKPFGCRTYPLALVDDGTSVRAVPRPECACVHRSGVAPAPGADETAAAPSILDPSATRREHLPREVFVYRLPPEVTLQQGVLAPRSAVADWSRAVAASATPDAAAAFAGLARALAAGVDGARDAALIAAPPALDPEPVLRRIVAMRDRAARLAHEGWRAPRDLAHQAFVAIETATELVLAAPDLFTVGPRSEREGAAEAFHLRAVIFGHLAWVSEGPVVLADWLDERAAVVVAARALGAVAELADLADPAFAWPLALTEAVVRGHAL